MFQVGLPCYLVLNKGRSVSVNVNKTKKHFSENIHGARTCFPNVSQFPIREIFFPVAISVFKMQIMLTLHDGEFLRKSEHGSSCKNFASTNKRALILFLRAIRAKAKFSEHFQIGWDHSIPLTITEAKLDYI